MTIKVVHRYLNDGSYLKPLKTCKNIILEYLKLIGYKMSEAMRTETIYAVSGGSPANRYRPTETVTKMATDNI